MPSWFREVLARYRTKAREAKASDTPFCANAAWYDGRLRRLAEAAGVSADAAWRALPPCSGCGCVG